MQPAQWGPEVFSLLHENQFSPFTVVHSKRFFRKPALLSDPRPVRDLQLTYRTVTLWRMAMPPIPGPSTVMPGLDHGAERPSHSRRAPCPPVGS